MDGRDEGHEIRMTAWRSKAKANFSRSGGTNNVGGRYWRHAAVAIGRLRPVTPIRAHYTNLGQVDPKR